jgi:hypothetical protein
MSPAVILAPAPMGELNEARRRTLEHGAGEAGGPSSLLVIAGAGKSSMLAHHLSP